MASGRFVIILEFIMFQLDCDVSLKIGFFSGWADVVESSTWRQGRKESAEERGAMRGMTVLLKLLPISSELSFLPMFPPLCCVNSPLFSGCLLPKSGPKATAFHNF